MRSPFVFPELFVRSVIRIVQPELVHEIQDVGPTGGGDDGGYVFVVSGGIAVFLEGTVAFVGPEAVNCPVVAGAGLEGVSMGGDGGGKENGV